MLEEILMHLNNWFVVPDDKHVGNFSVKDGGISLPFLQNGQYFRLIGSVFNDGLHQYPATDLNDEDFTGIVYALAIPKSLLGIADEISAWCDNNQPSAYTSESFGGYSYSKATNESGQPVSWQDVFRKKLNAWRKLPE